tara:strand:+ start:588 stop:1082 length:495 start_codon:yes stop_codon:yes gene_type:complete
MFGYRNLGFGSHPNRTVVDNITWSATVSATNYNSKAAVYNMGYDTSDPLTSASHGSIDDATVDGMVSVGGGTVSIIRITWWDDAVKANAVRIKLIPTGGSAGTEETNWVSITINGVKFLKADRQWNIQGAGGSVNQYEHVWNTNSNPFGTTSSGDFTVSMSNVS